MATRAFEVRTTTHAFDAPARAASVRRGISWSDHAMLAVIGLVVVLVSLPRLRRFAVRENESDAVRMLRVLSAGLAAHEGEASSPLLASRLLSAKPADNRLEDLEVLDDGSLRRHGYLFDVTRTSSGQTLLRAWPWRHRRTGLGAFACLADGSVIGYHDRDGRFSGVGHAPPPTLVDDPRWHVLALP